MRSFLLWLGGFFVGFGVGLFTCNPALSQERAPGICSDTLEEVSSYLARTYDERISWMGLASDDRRVFILFTAEVNDRETWTMTVRNVNDRTCVIGTGTSWNYHKRIEGVPN